MIEFLEATFTPNPAPVGLISASDVALEAGASEQQAAVFIAASWNMAETFTGRAYRGIASGEVLVRAHDPHEYRWPRYPFPDTITAEVWSDHLRGWDPVQVAYRGGYLDLCAGQMYRLVQAPTPPVDPMPQHVVQAVFNLAVYQLIQQPARREFKSQTMQDTTVTREALMGVLYGSGAGALLASEVRK